ncbi:unnamed protein product [Diatraea saccharalis]|uniref:Uncharacterized protein n=1 Tax=Diatraea saccharalis TaxID=40085 RepID=A0A9N9WCI9_9NEOP|nr:unnamed protein product [Diatraea saccharalis]
MASRKLKLLQIILFTLEAYKASAFYVGQPYSDVVVPIPEVSVTIGGTMTAYPVQREEVQIEQFTSTQFQIEEPIVNVQSFPYPNYFPPLQQPQILIVDEGNKNNNLDLILLLLLLGNRGTNNGCGGSNGCNGNNCYSTCYSGCYGYR